MNIYTYVCMYKLMLCYTFITNLELFPVYPEYKLRLENPFDMC